MEFLPLPQRPDGTPLPPTVDQIVRICERAFGSSVDITSARELGGGTFNTTFLINLDNQQVILRIAPPPDSDLLWNERWLMRREVQIQPFFAAIASRMPRMLLTDFTHQLIDRDYIFQTYLPGERWDQTGGRFTPDEELRLWEQFGNITKTIHSTVGTRFGGPYPAPEFSTWSESVLYHLECAHLAMMDEQLDVRDLETVLAIVRDQTRLLDRITQPRLLHGDLWLFNILVSQKSDGPTITGILDADRAWWGDPLADWTMFVLATSVSEKHPGHARFWQAYGQSEQTFDADFRRAVYEAMHMGTAMAWASRHDDADTVQRGKRDLRAVLKKLKRYAQ